MHSKILVALLIVALCSAIVNQYVSQAAMLASIIWCIPMLARRKQGASPMPQPWLLAMAFVSIAAIPMAVLSDSMRPMDAPLRYTVLIIPLLTLYRYKLPIMLLLRCFSSATLISAVLVLGLDLYQDTRFKFIDVTRYDFGLGLLDSAFAALFLLPICVAQLVLDRGKKWWQLLAVLGIAAALVIIIKSGTRASWLAMVSVPLIAQSLLARNSWRLGLAAIAFVVLAVVVSYGVAPMVKERVDAATINVSDYISGDKVSQENSLGLRFDLWKVAIETFRRSPIWGTSYEQRAAIKKEMIGTGAVTEHIGVHGTGSAHNELLNAMSQKGVLGLLAIVLLYWVPFNYFRKRCIRSDDATVRGISAAAAASVLTVAICGFAEAPLMSGRFAILYGFSLVLLYAMVEQQRTEQQKA